jgi:hypothetical protein
LMGVISGLWIWKLRELRLVTAKRPSKNYTDLGIMLVL